MFFSKGWFCIKFQFCINVFLRLRTDGWYVVTKGNICLRVFFFCCRADCFFAKLTSDNVISCEYPRVVRRDLKFKILSSNVVSEEFVLSSLSASLLVKPLFTPSGWLEVKCVYWKVSVGLYCVRMSRIDSFLKRSPLKIIVSRKVVSLSEISAVNLIIGWRLLACSMNRLISFLSLSHSEKMSSIKRFHSIDLFCFDLSFLSQFRP